MTNHTPGPWQVEFDESPLDYQMELKVSSSEGTICSFFDKDSTTQSNASLIAAAPELLAALQFLINTSAPMTGQQEQCWISIRAAIDKATGKT